jgi:hypothetical protein
VMCSSSWYRRSTHTEKKRHCNWPSAKCGQSHQYVFGNETSVDAKKITGHSRIA